MKILALMKYGDRAASTRQRMLQYREALAHARIEVDVASLLTNDYIGKLYAGERPSLIFVVSAYLARLGRLIRAGRYDGIWIHCESFPYLPGFVERLAAASGKPVIVDFDDAIFHQYDAHANPVVRLLLRRKLEPLLRSASLCICGNGYLKAYTDRFSMRSVIVPTVVDTGVYVPGPVRDGPLVVGWIGSPATWQYFLLAAPVLKRLAEELGFVIRVVGSGQTNSLGERFEFVQWSEEGEVAAIQGMDIGVMPLPDDPWARGKCGYKLIQYMACGVPVVASPVGVNCEIVDDGVNGFLARNDGEWAQALRCLAGNRWTRLAMGERGRKRVVNSYSLRAHGPRLVGLVRSVLAGASEEACLEQA